MMERAHGVLLQQVPNRRGLQDAARLQEEHRRGWPRAGPPDSTAADSTSVRKSVTHIPAQEQDHATRLQDGHFLPPGSTGLAVGRGIEWPELHPNRDVDCDPAEGVRAVWSAHQAPDWKPQHAPPVPMGWGPDAFQLPSHRRRLLQLMHPHPRDVRIWFDEGPHEYWVDGIVVGWSVTALVKKLSNEFLADEVIAQMRNGSNWPRAGYVTLSPRKRLTVTDELSAVMSATGYTPYMGRVRAAAAASPPTEPGHGEAPPRDELAASLHELQTLCAASPSPVIRGIKLAVDALADDDEVIISKWAENKIEAANRGTWMHLQCELWLNRDGAHLESAEMQLFLRYVRERLAPNHVVAFRTEWEVFGETIDLAGSIDFVGVVTSGPDAGGLWLVDWKRTKELRYKSHHRSGYCMLPPLDHIPDTSKWHYAIQLNLYSYLLETYYDMHVVHCEVACFHPDYGDMPYYYEVPAMPCVTNYLIALQRQLAADRVLHRALVGLGTDGEKQARATKWGL